MADKKSHSVSVPRRLVLALVGGAALLPLAACGRKSAPKPPSGDDAPFPRDYPST